MTFGTACSGIGSPEVAWSRLGWESRWAMEIDPFASAVLAARHPATRNIGDVTNVKGKQLETVDVFIAGTPCQSFSVAGKRTGLDDPRGVLVWEFFRLVRELRPRWFAWENVLGVLSIDGGRAFGAILGAVAELGYGFAYRILDAQHFGVPQRRRRVFLVGHSGDWRRAAAVLFERESLRGNFAQGGKTKPEIAGTLGARIGDGIDPTDFERNGGYIVSTGKLSHCLNAGAMGRQDYESETLVAHALCADGFDASEDGTGRGTPIIASTFKSNSGSDGFGSDPNETFIFESRFARNGRGAPDTICPPLKAQSGQTGKGDAAPVVAAIRTANTGANGHGIAMGVSHTLDAAMGQAVQQGATVRRLTPRECERLQGFPDDYTLIEYKGRPAADGPRYRALGNSMAVPVIEWIGRRIEMVDSL